MVKVKQNPWWNWKLVKYGEIKSNQLVRPACSQAASAAWPKVKQTAENICEPREICGYDDGFMQNYYIIILHKTIIATAVRHGQITKLFFGQLMWYLRIPSTASRMDHMQAKALNIFQESNTTVSHLLPQFQHKRRVLRKGQIGIGKKYGHYPEVNIAKTVAVEDLIHLILILWVPWVGSRISRRASSFEEVVPTWQCQGH